MMPEGSTGPLGVARIFSIENGHSGQAIVRAKDIQEVQTALHIARDTDRFALLTRIDGEPVLINPRDVFLVGELPKDAA